MAGFLTTPITLDQMIYHASSVEELRKELVVVDLPFEHINPIRRSPCRIRERIRCSVLKKWEQVKDSIERIIQAGIPVMGHLGLTPQSIYKFGLHCS